MRGEGVHANLTRRETFTHVESANKKIDFEMIWSDIAWRFYSHCGPFGILSEYFLVFSESTCISIRKAFFWFARYGKLFSFDMPQLCIVSFDTFLLFFMHFVNFFFLIFSAWKGQRLKLQTHVNELANSFSFLVTRCHILFVATCWTIKCGSRETDTMTQSTRQCGNDNYI